METINLKTSDNVDLVGDYYPGTTSQGALLLHMMPADRSSWRPFAPKLVEAGYHVLAIDLRGHGQSGGGPEGYKDFSDEEHQQSILDVEAGIAFLQGKGVSSDKLVLMGASIGANLSLWQISDKTEFKQAILLSPGIDYRGVQAEPMMKKLSFGQRVLFASSEDDGDNVAQNRALTNLAPADIETKLIVYKSAGHGTNMFAKEEPDLENEIIKWLKE